ncbi:MAG: DUF4097 family beta strand repeat-containing protein [Bacteroidota bacterium]
MFKGKLYTAIFLFGWFLLFAGNLFAEDLRLIKEETFSVSSGQELLVDAGLGDVEINSWDKNEVNVKILGNRKAEDKLKFFVEQTLSGVSVKVEKEGKLFSNWFSNLKLRIEILVPQKFDVKSNTSGGDIKIADIQGSVEAKTSGGDIKANSLNGKLVAKTSGGDVVIKNSTGEKLLKTSGGDIKCLGSNGKVEAYTSGGNIDLQVESGAVKAATSGGDVKLVFKGENEGIKLSTSGGDIEVVLPANFKADAALITSGGDIDCNVETSKVTKITSSKFIGELNGGGPALDCKTTGGDVKVSTL